jgi:precorrin-6Y C5,15-methyltransferase (decarboxylating)
VTEPAALACARLGWPAAEVEVVQVADRLEVLHPAVQPGRRLLALPAGGDTPARICALLVARGYGGSEVRALERLGAPGERVLAASAARWIYPPAAAGTVVAVRCRPDAGAPLLTRTPGLPSAAYAGPVAAPQVRALTLAALAPVPGQLLWDVGAGAGGVAIEWMRAHPSCRAVAVERHPERADAAERNAAALGVPGLRVLRGTAPRVLAGLEPPAAVSVAAADPAVLAACWDALPPGGRLVATATETATGADAAADAEAVLADWHARHGGDLYHVAITRADAASRVTQWVAIRG